MERITITDGALTVELQHWLQLRLYGDTKEVGLYSMIAHGLPTWDGYQRAVGTVQAYESVLQKMNDIAHQRGSDLEERVVISRPGLN